MKVFHLTLVLYVFLLIHGAACAQNSHDLIGSWHNESQATLSITAIAPNGRISGSYIVRETKQAFPLFGWAGPAKPEDVPVVPVLFRVQGGAYGTLTVWAGYLSKGKDGKLSITTMWNIVRAYADPDSSPDNGAVNFAVFKPGPAP